MLYLHQIFSSVWMIQPDYASNYLPLIASYIKGEAQPVSSSRADRQELSARNAILTANIHNGAYQLSEYGEYFSPENAPENSIAIVDISGSITKHNQDCGPAGMLTKANLLERCYANDKIKGVVLNIDSGGGSAHAMLHMAEKISQRNKPVVAYVEDAAYSAAYGIACGCDHIVANNNLAGVGSIGTYMTIADYSEYYKNLGINLIDIYATASTDKNQLYYQAIKGNKKPLEDYVNAFNNEFLTMVETNRKGKITTDRDAWSTGKEFFAEDAIHLGLVDSIDTFNNVLNYFND